MVPQSCYTGRYWSAKGAFDECHSFPTAIVSIEVDEHTAEAELIVSDRIPPVGDRHSILDEAYEQEAG